MEKIESVKNPLVKKMASLRQKEGRDAEKLIFVEGEKLIDEALDAGQLIRYCFVSGNSPALARAVAAGARAYAVEAHVMKSMADTVTPQSIAAAFALRAPDDEPGAHYPLVVLDGVQDPGNVGTIWRTADAAGYRGILLGEGCADAFSPKVQRATMGSCFRLPAYNENLESALEKLKYLGFQIIAATLSGENVFEIPEYPVKHVLIIGSEARGVGEAVARMADMFVKIPMRGGAESLNAAVSAGILMYTLTK